MMKDLQCLWDMSKLQPGEAQDLPNAAAQMRSKRLPPISPTAFGSRMRKGVASGGLAFTSGADMEMVIGLYERGFVEQWEEYSATYGGRLIWEDLGWDDDDATIIADALKYLIEHCAFPKPLRLILRGNKFTQVGADRIYDAVPEDSAHFQVFF